MTLKENIIKSVRFENPESIPMTFHINDACWNHYPQEWLKEMMGSHAYLFPDYEYSDIPIIPEYHGVARKDEPFTDDWGCLWQTSEDGITGSVVKHPLLDWKSFNLYKAPDPEKCNGIGPVDWLEIEKEIKMKKAVGELISGGLVHGHTFLRLCDVRGYENVIYDMMDENPSFLKLLHMMEEFNSAIIKKYLSLGAQFISYPEDLGMEIGPMISPDLFKQFIKPVYQRMMKPAIDAGAIIHMHSDGDIRSLASDLIEGGVDALNLQDLVNGVEWISENLAGKVCIDLDIDRVKITPFGTPEQIDSLIREEVEMLGSKDGGLMMIYGLYPGVPRKNVEALMDAMERYAGYYS